MRRYKFLTKDSVYAALNKLRAAFLAARDGKEVEDIIKGILTYDERMKIGRRIQIIQLLKAELTYEEIKTELKVGKNTIALSERKMNQNPLCVNLILKREEKVEKEFKQKAFSKIGGSKMIFKKREYTGFSRKNVGR